MGMEALKTMKTQLEGCVQGQLGNLDKVDAHELGQAIDMIKDLSQAIYYCTITESMEKADKKEQQTPVNNMEGKEMHKDTNSQLKELEAYLQELSADITEMIKDASPEERSTLRQKMTTLASKIA